MKSMALLCAVVIGGGCALQSGHSSQVENVGRGEPDVDGAYEFVSETTTLTKPEKRTFHYAPPEWTGLWIFKNNRFSQTSMRQRRSWDPFPRNQQDLGYTSSAGSYKIEGTRLILKQELSLNPAAIGYPAVSEYKLEGDTLTLIESLYPRPEDLSEGQQIIVLRKIK